MMREITGTACVKGFMLRLCSRAQEVVSLRLEFPEQTPRVLSGLVQAVDDARDLISVALRARRSHSDVGCLLGGEAPLADRAEAREIGERQGEGVRILGRGGARRREDGKDDGENGDEGALHEGLQVPPIYRTRRLSAFLRYHGAVTRALLPLVLVLTGAPVRCQDPARVEPGRLFVRFLEGVPTERALAAGIRTGLGDRLLLNYAPGAVLTARDVVVVLDGADVSDLSPAGLILAGRSSLGSQANVIGRVTLTVSPSSVRRVIKRVLPGTRRVLALARGDVWNSVAEDVTITTELLPRHREEVARGAYEALFIDDDRRHVAPSETLIRLGAEHGVPAVTTAPWLARSSSAVGVIPDLDVAASRIVGLIEHRRRGPVLVPSITTIHLGAWRDAGLPSSVARLAWAHRVHGAGVGALR